MSTLAASVVRGTAGGIPTSPVSDVVRSVEVDDCGGEGKMGAGGSPEDGATDAATAAAAACACCISARCRFFWRSSPVRVADVECEACSCDRAQFRVQCLLVLRQYEHGRYSVSSNGAPVAVAVVLGTGDTKKAAISRDLPAGSRPSRESLLSDSACEPRCTDSRSEGASHARLALRHWSQEWFWRLMPAAAGTHRVDGGRAGMFRDDGEASEAARCDQGGPRT